MFRNVAKVLALTVVASLIAISLSFVARGINPIAASRHAIEECELVEDEIIARVSANPSNTLAAAYGTLMRARGEVSMTTTNLREPLVLDAWDHPLNFAYRTNLPEWGLVGSFRTKTNAIIIWSSGPNGRNEYGQGDDVILNRAPFRPPR
jgi:hypothetical protein